MAQNMVIVDYGHGGIVRGSYATAGKQYLHSDEAEGLELWIGEGIVNRMVAAHFIRMLLRAGLRVMDCVAECEWRHAPSWLELAQPDKPLQFRVHDANYWQEQHPDAPVLSIHSNAQQNASSGPSHPADGVSVFTSPGQTQSDALAAALYATLKNSRTLHGLRIRPGDWTDGDEDHEARFSILTDTKGPAVLVEAGFMDHLPDAQKLVTRRTQRQLARCYADACISYWRDR